MMQHPHVIVSKSINKLSKNNNNNLQSDFQHYYKCVGIQIFDEPAGCSGLFLCVQRRIEDFLNNIK